MEKGEALDSYTLLWKSCDVLHFSSTTAADSLKVGYGWADGGSNTIRQTGCRYPNAGILEIDYGSGLDSSLSRPLALKESRTTFASMKYLGLGIQVGLKYDGASDTQLTSAAHTATLRGLLRLPFQLAKIAILPPDPHFTLATTSPSQYTFLITYFSLPVAGLSETPQ